MLGHGGIGHALATRLNECKTFAGWEYVLDDALHTSPAQHPHWSGGAIVDMQGRLIGIGSLLVHEAGHGEAKDANMSVPVELLDPILDGLQYQGRPNRPPRPWLGIFVQEQRGPLTVGGLTMRGPAASAGMELGDEIEAVAGQRVHSLVQLFRCIWAQGPAGTPIVLSVRREERLLDVRAASIDRDSILWRPQGLN